MTDKSLNIDSIVNHWKESSDKDYQTMLNLFNSSDYNWALFLGHLVIEKLLKAIYVKKFKKHAIFGHDLLRLASKTDLVLSEEQSELFDRLTTFNINTRYDSYKQEFNKLCTKEFAEEWKLKIEELRRWLKAQL
ncbi:MAG: HEPN domain-containing protein [Bacteroidales bacterium]|nr:HEPN domain-containing protein [Bacteroidales bacterium]MCF8391939.1 HEPN domain-containing protein [Bacteroidales bacterium]